MAANYDFEDTIIETTATFMNLVEQYNCFPFIAIFTGLFCCDLRTAH